MEKPFLSGNLKLDEVSLRKVFLYNLNQIYPILNYLSGSLPEIAKSTYYGDLQYAIEELLSEVQVQIFRIKDIFIQLNEVPCKKCTHDTTKMLQILDYVDEHKDNLSKDLSIVFYIQKVLSVQKNYFHILKSIANTLNSVNIKQYLQFSCDECKDNQTIFTLIAKEYMESTINSFLK
ncbi:DUF892 family protein [Mucilaginibacter arboris]|uniref:DUF892 family protein n=1 Tax=Mucilaginibacter arboris TaxID=2682090 RepID=A0A7K1SZD7_9SPHI|nr:DUF892 family protein [Mucilaginibacter arboris]MVN22663.1 DUF892 family protein [Mucilaginibacter arboris]